MKGERLLPHRYYHGFIELEAKIAVFELQNIGKRQSYWTHWVAGNWWTGGNWIKIHCIAGGDTVFNIEHPLYNHLVLPQVNYNPIQTALLCGSHPIDIRVISHLIQPLV